MSWNLYTYDEAVVLLVAAAMYVAMKVGWKLGACIARRLP